MTTRAQLAVLALLIVLAILAFFFWPAPTQGDAPVVSSAVPAAEFLPLDGNSASDVVLAPANEARTVDIRALPTPPELRAVQPVWGDDSAETGLGTGWYESARPPTPSPSASKRVPTPTPVSRHPVGHEGASSGSSPATGSTAPSKAGISGVASWFASPVGVSAAGPALRTALGPGWRGSHVRVTGPAGSAVVVLGDWMRADRLVDLDDDVFPAVCGPLSRGICQAKVTW